MPGPAGPYILADVEDICGGGGTVDAEPSKGSVRKGVWVRIPPAASIDSDRRAGTTSVAHMRPGATLPPPAPAATQPAPDAPPGSPMAAARARAAPAHAVLPARISTPQRRCPTA